MGEASLKEFRDRFSLPISDERLNEIPFLRFAEDSTEMKYLRERRAALGGSLPTRRRKSAELEIPPLSAFEAQLKSTASREISTTMAFVRILNTLLRDKKIGKRVVRIVPDESRTFGMKGMFRQFGIFSQVGQLYRPEDANQLMFYKEDQNGQMRCEGPPAPICPVFGRFSRSPECNGWRGPNKPRSRASRRQRLQFRGLAIVEAASERACDECQASFASPHLP
jgi:pyruvate dehydrogenase E1 component